MNVNFNGYGENAATFIADRRACKVDGHRLSCNM